MPARPFVQFGSDHLTVLGLVVAIGAAMIAVARSGTLPGLARRQELALAIALFACWPAKLVAALLSGLFDLEAALPFHLCDLAALSGAVALLTRWRLGAELLYFWGLAGTLNGLITPTVTAAFPNPVFISFFLLHGGVVLAAFYVALGTPLWPRPGAVPRVAACTLAYLAAICLFNLVTGTNFAFTRFKPVTPSLLDSLGPWPCYVLALIPLGSLVFLLLYAPFYLVRKLWAQCGLTSPAGLLSMPSASTREPGPQPARLDASRRVGD